MVSRCAQVLAGDERKIIPWGSTAWGMCRTVSLEIPSIRTTAVDLSEANKNELNLLVTELQVKFICTFLGIITPQKLILDVNTFS